MEDLLADADMAPIFFSIFLSFFSQADIQLQSDVLYYAQNEKNG